MSPSSADGGDSKKCELGGGDAKATEAAAESTQTADHDCDMEL